MGVTHLWTILDPVKEHKPLADLRGQILAVDLSMWVCETQGVKQMQGTVTRPYLRNLFFRTCHLLQLGVLPVFVVEGEPPELKWDTMLQRQQSRFGGSVSRGRGRSRGERKMSKGRKPGRSHFKAWLRECCELLKCLGVPFVQSEGEAEAMCALLNKEGLVDGCLTDDGDAFLYGAKTVYRNFTMNSKDPHVEMFTSASIESQLGLNRESLVGLALLLGCDYLPKGVPGVGKEMGIKLMQGLGSCNVLNRFRQWQHCSQMHLDAMEIPVYKKSQQLKDFPNEKVISEFLNTRDRVPTVKFDWKRPQIKTLQSFTLQRLEWPIEYTLDKVLPLVTMWDMTVHSKSSAKMIRLKPHRIVKSRVRQGVSCYEVEWFKESWDTDTEADYYVTVEDQVIFTMNFPEVVRMFELTIEQKKKPRRKGSKASKSDTQDVEKLATAVQSINIDEHPMKTTQELRHEISTYEENIFQQKERTSEVVSSKSNYTCTLKSALDSQNVYSSQSVATGLHPAAPKCEQNVALKVDSQEVHSKYGENHQDEEDFDISVVPLSQRLKMRGLHSKGLGNSRAKSSFAENVGKPVPAVGKTNMVVDQIILTSEDKDSIKQDLDTYTARIGIASSLQTAKPLSVNVAVEQSVLYRGNVISEMKSYASGVLKSPYKEIDVSQSIQERPRSNFLLNESNCNVDRGTSQELSDKTNIQAESDEKVVTSPSLMNEQKVSHSVNYREDEQDAYLHSTGQLLSASHYSDSTSEEPVKQLQHVTEVQNEIESPLAPFQVTKISPSNSRPAIQPEGIYISQTDKDAQAEKDHVALMWTTNLAHTPLGQTAGTSLIANRLGEAGSEKTAALQFLRPSHCHSHLGGDDASFSSTADMFDSPAGNASRNDDSSLVNQNDLNLSRGSMFRAEHLMGEPHGTKMTGSNSVFCASHPKQRLVETITEDCKYESLEDKLNNSSTSVTTVRDNKNAFGSTTQEEEIFDSASVDIMGNGKNENAHSWELDGANTISATEKVEETDEESVVSSNSLSNDATSRSISSQSNKPRHVTTQISTPCSLIERAEPESNGNDSHLSDFGNFTIQTSLVSHFNDTADGPACLPSTPLEKTAVEPSFLGMSTTFQFHSFHDFGTPVSVTPGIVGGRRYMNENEPCRALNTYLESPYNVCVKSGNEQFMKTVLENDTGSPCVNHETFHKREKQNSSYLSELKPSPYAICNRKEQKAMVHNEDTPPTKTTIAHQMAKNDAGKNDIGVNDTGDSNVAEKSPLSLADRLRKRLGKSTLSVKN